MTIVNGILDHSNSLNSIFYPQIQGVNHAMNEQCPVTTEIFYHAFHFIFQERMDMFRFLSIITGKLFLLLNRARQEF